MSRRIKIFFACFAVSIFFFWGINIFSQDLEDFLFDFHYEPSLAQSSLIDFVNEADDKQETEENDVPVFEIEAKSAISVKINSKGEQEILFEKDPDAVLPIASLTKLMTAWVVFQYPEYYELSDSILISEEALEKNENFGVKENEEISLETLLYSMLVESSNYSAYAIAENLGSKEEHLTPKERVEAFIYLMNLEAKENLKLENTDFINCTGLDDGSPYSLKNQSTARDLAQLSWFILSEHPEIFDASIKPSYPVSNIYNEHIYLATNKNQLIGQLSNVVGGKTGWTYMAGGCIVLIQKNESNECFIHVILGTDSQESRFSEAKKLAQHVYQP